MNGQAQNVAFTAVHPDLGRIDASRGDLGCGLEWSGIYRVRPRIPLVCPECGFGVHAKLSRRGLRYFAHDPGRPPECQLSNESIEHHLLKLELATAIRDAGWHAELEVRAQDGSWRADVMASSLDGQRRWAWEAQLSPITDADLLERTARYAAAGIEVCWVSPREAVPWLDIAPAVRVAQPRGGRGWTVADGLAGFDERRGAWFVAGTTPLTSFVGWALEGKVFPHPVLRRYRRVHLDAEREARRCQLWTTDLSVRKQQEHDGMRQRQEARRAERERREEEAEARRLAAEKAEREERERVRKIEEEARRIEAAERTRQLTMKRERERLARQEQERAAAEERAQRARREAQALAEREERERQDAEHWWAEVSGAQWEELLGAIAEYSLKHAATRAVPQQAQTERKYAYGVALYAGGKLYGIARPHPGSLYRLTGDSLVFVRTAREAERIVAQGVGADRVIHFGLPEHEQLQLY